MLSPLFLLLLAPIFAHPTDTNNACGPGPEHHRPPHKPHPRPPHEDCSYSAPGSRYFYLSNVTYYSSITYSTPAHLAVAWAQLTFNLTNNAAGYNAVCKGQVSGSNEGDFFSWPQVFQCEEDAGADGDAMFTYVAYPDHKVSVNETWVCGKHHYLGYASASLNLNCKIDEWVNPNFTWPNNGGLDYSHRTTTCDPVDVPMIPAIVKTD
ncbi:hypothetical protein BCR34DRAFT_588897 [Clohesyomyces aquaticus]|uniref:AA1-like domain-containing protein n=1 Tax=Clohesyomyces aquaticus TaxID=1231657 RepID=A0A1Y1ZJS3_9PLEO|nr:hypothetical protein BCR34DRAFT_588897 [Clohesyomyces aquaticus]